METIILPLDINISDAIMSFQESGFQITQKVFDACGKPNYLNSRSKREAAPAAGADRSGSGRAISLDGGNRPRLQGVGHATENGKETAPAESSTLQPMIQNKGKSDFERMMEELRRVVRRTEALSTRLLSSNHVSSSHQVRNSQGFWRHMPYVMCLNTDTAAEEEGDSESVRLNPKHRPLEDQRCWNGSDLAPYKEGSADASGLARTSNGPSVFNEQLFKLQRITHQVCTEVNTTFYGGLH